MSKQSDGEAPVMLELWGMWSTPLLASPWSTQAIIATGMVLSMGQIELNSVLTCVG